MGMQRPPRNNKVDRLVTKKLVSFAYLQIGVIQACAGFYTWMVVLNDYGYPPNILPGNGGTSWGKQPMYCKLEGGEFCNAGLNNDLRCIASPAAHCRPVPAGYGSILGKAIDINDDCVAATQTGPCWVCTPENPTGYFEMPSNKVDGVFNCDPTEADYPSTIVDSTPSGTSVDGNGYTVQNNLKDELARYPGKEWYGRNCFGYDSTLPKDYRGFYPFWRPAANGDILDCAHAYQNVAPEGGKPANFPKSYQMSSRYSTESDFGQKKAGSTMPGYAFTTAQSYASLLQKGYMPYYPHRSRMSPFYHQAWFWASTSNPKHEEIPQSLGGNVNELILFNFQALNGRWAFPHTGLTFVAPASIGSNGYPVATDGKVPTIAASGSNPTQQAVREAFRATTGSADSHFTWGNMIYPENSNSENGGYTGAAPGASANDNYYNKEDTTGGYGVYKAGESTTVKSVIGGTAQTVLSGATGSQTVLSVYGGNLNEDTHKPTGTDTFPQQARAANWNGFDGAGLKSFIPATSSAAKERQDTITDGWVTTISIKSLPQTCAGGTETMPTVGDFTDKDGKKIWFKLGKQMYHQTFVTSRYYADGIGGVGGLTYAGTNTDAPNQVGSGTTAHSTTRSSPPTTLPKLLSRSPSSPRLALMAPRRPRPPTPTPSTSSTRPATPPPVVARTLSTLWASTSSRACPRRKPSITPRVPSGCASSSCSGLTSSSARPAGSRSRTRAWATRR